MIKLLGTAMILLGSGSAGFGFARAVRAQLRQLNALLAALEAMKGEIEYRLTPLPELFAALALCCVGALGGVCAAACARRPE